MADAAVSATIKVALQAVVSLAADHREFPEELERLDKSAAMIRGFLAGADEDKHSSDVKNWLKQLEEEVFKADNVLDELNYDNLRRKVKYQNQLTKKKVFFCFSFFNKIGFRWRLGSMIREINTNLQRIRRDAEGLGLAYKHQVEEAFPTIAAGATTSRQTDSTIVRRDVLGRDEDESEIVKKLLTESESVISVIPITGMGGLGKTTLAKAVYKNEQIVGQFDKKMWVCVAEEVDKIEKVFKMILESLTGGKVEGDRREVIVQKIQHELKEKRYFLVLDDLWNDQEVLLNDFFSTLAGLNAKKGSWCLVTTRLQEVATILSRHPQINFTRHELGKLCDNDCWSIMKKWANVGEELPKELEDMREQVLRRCDGLPLAATLIGGLLSKKRKEDWLSILEESLLNGNQGGIKQILKVSFDHLSPAPVKKCFAYCSIFDQDTELEQDRLVELWMAEGFLQPDPQNERMMEKIGCEYLRILLQTSLLEEVKEERRTWYKMHDLVHEFAKSILNRSSSNEDRYLSLYSSERMLENMNEKKSASLRTLFLKGGIADEILSKFKHLHVLKLSGEDVKELPTSIGKLIHLHLLDISDSMITTLPESLCELYSLQTLRIYALEKGFPKKMSNLISMRHLHYFHYRYDKGCKIQMPSSIGRLTCLQTLEFFNIGRQEEGRGIQELGTLQDLKGTLEIRNLESVNGKDDAELANLSKKPHMYRLVFEWGNRDRESDNCDEDVLEGLQPHPNLKELQILKFMGDQFPQWFMNLTSLVELRVANCTRCRELPTLGQLSSLQHLYLTGLENIRSIGLSFYSTSAEEDGGSGGSGTVSRQTFFPALKILSLESMENLEEWKDAHEIRSTAGEVHVMDVFPMLEELYISHCPKLTTIPTPSRFPSLDVLKIKKNCHVLLAEKVLSNMANLSSLELWDLGGQRIESLKLVKRPESSLSIEGCNSLPTDMLERLCLFPTLQRVELRLAANITTLRGMSCAACLKRLVVFCCDNLRELPEDLYQFQALEYLLIQGCPRINSFGYPNPNSFGQKGLLKSLEEFTIEGCDALTRLPAEMFESCTSLRELNLFGCPSLVSFPLDLRRTPSLESFILGGCPNLIAEMPSGFGYLTSLRRVSIGPFSDDSAIKFDWAGLASSSSLRHVSLCGMPDMKSLPHQLQCLTTITSPSVDAMERLTFRRLRIRDCPLLTDRCTPQSGSECPKISNIPERRIVRKQNSPILGHKCQ
nr:disease resistance protein RGA2-like [Coffea arabica]XP_027074430.1 disease resistance protein RGA2-like [Coffea arabica]XP_027074437.1 disease resistance protein RGA2-like [Coffea arabica]XP_027074446.1 disease resistance protein RGA2-like [Coffea arabica]XP_027074455.1 disease resistance protein RGA2-like [Coffea arabica]XP_027074462.1 disease resistance protein RGA2-like [Coffea arabica]XP_027074470.1 disease resistance protein RGA2-like [Coffea arabica]XP_027074476.1 disease resistanc